MKPPRLRLAGSEAADVQRLLDSAGLHRAAGLSAPVIRAAQHTARAGADKVWPVPTPLRDLLPVAALRRGSTVSVLGCTSLLFALISSASQQGAWAALVGMPQTGALAANELGVNLAQFALVPFPGPRWQAVVGALLDGVDLVLVRPPGPVAASDARRLAARARQRGAVLISAGVWDGAEVALRMSASRWDGLGQGRGRLRSRQITVTASGKGSLAQPREVSLWLPAPDGTPIATAQPDSISASAEPRGPHRVQENQVARWLVGR
jgi:hypothetical protein